MTSSKNIFEKIIDREMQADIVYDDDRVIAFRDIAPQAPLHVLIIPKRRIESLGDAIDSDVNLLGYLLLIAAKIAVQLGVSNSGYRIVINNGSDAGQAVKHIHLHLLGGRTLTWPPG